MNAKFLGTLLIAAAAAVGLVVYLQQPDSGVGAENPRLVEGLEAQLNDISDFSLIAADNTPVVELSKGDEGWVVVNRGGYPADVGTIRETLLALANAEQLEQKTANPEFYDRLGVVPVDNPEAAGVRFDLQGLTEPVSIIVGNPAGSGIDGTFVRFADQAQSWLVSGSLTPDIEMETWLDRGLISVSHDRIQSITITHPDGHVLRLSKDEPGARLFTVGPIPEGRELESETAPNRLTSALGSLQLSDVQAVGTVEFPEDQTINTEYRTFDGLVIQVEAYPGEENYARFQVSFDEEQAERFVSTAEDESDTTVTDGDEDAGGEDDGDAVAAAVSPEEQADIYQSRFEGWVYVLPLHKFQEMTRRLDHFLAAPAEVVSNAPEVPEAPASATISDPATPSMAGAAAVDSAISANVEAETAETAEQTAGVAEQTAEQTAEVAEQAEDLAEASADVAEIAADRAEAAATEADMAETAAELAAGAAEAAAAEAEPVVTGSPAVETVPASAPADRTVAEEIVDFATEEESSPSGGAAE